MSRGGWIVVGVLVALLLVPSGMAVAKALQYTGIEGTSLNRADVTPAGQLKVAPAAPDAFFQSAEASLSLDDVLVAAPPASSALIVTTIHIDTFADPSPGGTNEVKFEIFSTSTCTGSVVGTYGQTVNPDGVGEIDIPLGPGLAVASGQSLCGAERGSEQANASASGYTVPASAV
jgi:hypothetical protein